MEKDGLIVSVLKLLTCSSGYKANTVFCLFQFNLVLPLQLLTKDVSFIRSQNSNEKDFFFYFQHCSNNIKSLAKKHKQSNFHTSYCSLVI